MKSEAKITTPQVAVPNFSLQILRLVQNMIEEVLRSAIIRCVDPTLMEMSVSSSKQCKGYFST